MSQEQTQTTFGYKWQNFPIVDNVRDIEERSVGRIERNGWEASEFHEWLDGKTVLDAGCGMGWFTRYLTEHNESGAVYGMDISEMAVRKGKELQPDVNLLVGDLTAPPFPDESLDYIACEEVIHHTPDPPATLDRLVSRLVPDGVFTMYIYKEKPLLREHADTVIRERTTEMDIEAVHDFAHQMSQLGEALYEVDEKIEVPDIPLLDVEAGTYSVQEFVYRFLCHCYFDWTNEDMEWSIANNFDWYHPEYAFRYTESEVRSMVADAGLELEHFNEQMSGFSVRARKPDAD